MKKKEKKSSSFSSLKTWTKLDRTRGRRGYVRAGRKIIIPTKHVDQENVRDD
jgi:hypothetical protein